MIGLTGCFASAVGAPSSVTTGLDINKLITPAPTPDYSRTVLEPLHKQQAAQAAAQAKAEADRAEADRAADQASQAQVEQVSEVRTVQPGNCATWLAQAGVTDVADAMWIINRESGCNPSAVNAASGACGVAQELPCGKSGCAVDPVCQIRWMQGYVNSRYGGWAGAVGFWQAHNWY